MAISKRLRHEVMRRDGYVCRYCGDGPPDVKLTVDHVVPSALGGSDDPSNLCAACPDCNAGKAASSPGADLVAQVDEDARRWADAMRQAAARADAVRAVAAKHQQAWQDEWNLWTRGGARVPLGPGWRKSIDAFLAAGLTMRDLITLIGDVMERRGVDDVFLYYCGAAWKSVNLRQEAAQVLLKAAPPVAEAEEPVDVMDEEDFDRLAYAETMKRLMDADCPYWVEHPSGIAHRPWARCAPRRQLRYESFLRHENLSAATYEELVGRNSGWPEFFCPQCCLQERHELWPHYFGHSYTYQLELDAQEDCASSLVYLQNYDEEVPF